VSAAAWPAARGPGPAGRTARASGRWSLVTPPPLAADPGRQVSHA
jgi:hypothetical protein